MVLADIKEPLEAYKLMMSPNVLSSTEGERLSLRQKGLLLLGGWHKDLRYGSSEELRRAE